jgi:hypothetical protein
MAYSDFSLEAVLETFNLKEDRGILFDHPQSLPLSEWLQETLRIGLNWGLTSGTEKARSECIVMPILMELDRRNPNFFTLYSGKTLTVDAAKGLTGECDFILSKSKPLKTIQAPILALVEAKKNDLDLGLGQCAAQVVAAQLLNQQKQHPTPMVYGCVTTGENWQFLRLQEQCLTIDVNTYTVKELETILGVFQMILDTYR